MFNAQTLITPTAYAAGTTLDKVPAGTGAWKLESYNAADRRELRAQRRLVGRQDAARQCRVHLLRRHRPDGHRLPGPAGRRASSSSTCFPGKSLLTDPNFNLIAAEASLHRQIWMRCDTGQFTDKEVRQALAYTFDRPALIQQLFQGKAELGNDHVICAAATRTSTPSVPQRTQDIAKAKQLLSDGRRDQPDGDPALRPAPRDP